MKKKLNLNKLKIESFVTNIDASKEHTVQGGKSGNACILYTNDNCIKSWIECRTLQYPCRNTVNYCNA